MNKTEKAQVEAIINLIDSFYGLPDDEDELADLRLQIFMALQVRK